MGNECLSQAKKYVVPPSIYEVHPKLRKWKPQFDTLLLSQYEIAKLYRTFCKVDLDHGGTIGLVELLTLMDVERTPFTIRVFSIFDEDGSGEIDFYEFVLALWNYCTLSSATLEMFAFDLYDKNSDGILDFYELEELIKDVYGKEATTNTNAVGLLNELREIDLHQDIDAETFCKFSKYHNKLLFPAFEMQIYLQTNTLGRHFWNNNGERRVRLSEGRYVPIGMFMELHLDKELYTQTMFGATDFVDTRIGTSIEEGAVKMLITTGTRNQRHESAAFTQHREKKMIIHQKASSSSPEANAITTATSKPHQHASTDSLQSLDSSTDGDHHHDDSHLKKKKKPKHHHHHTNSNNNRVSPLPTTQVHNTSPVHIPINVGIANINDEVGHGVDPLAILNHIKAEQLKNKQCAQTANTSYAAYFHTDESDAVVAGTTNTSHSSDVKAPPTSHSALHSGQQQHVHSKDVHSKPPRSSGSGSPQKHNNDHNHNHHIHSHHHHIQQHDKETKVKPQHTGKHESPIDIESTSLVAVAGEHSHDVDDITKSNTQQNSRSRDDGSHNHNHHRHTIATADHHSNHVENKKESSNSSSPAKRQTYHKPPKRKSFLKGYGLLS